MSGSSISDAERLACLRLYRSQNVGPVTYRQLLNRYRSAEAALRALPELAKRGGRKRPIKISSVKDAEDELAALAALGGKLIVDGDADFPEPLSVLEDAPPPV